MSNLEKRTCETSECNLPAKLQCPTCMKLGIQNSFFCSQDCFKSSWRTHKLIHKLVGKYPPVYPRSTAPRAFITGALISLYSMFTENVENDRKDTVSCYNPWPNYHYTGKLRPFPQTMKRLVPDQILRPEYADDEKGVPLMEQKSKLSSHIRVLNDEEIEGMRVACKLGREVLEEVSKMIDVGVTTEEIDRVVHEACVDRECYPSPLNYYQFPKSCCTSVNEVICHGIPDMRPLVDGDICNVDVTVYHRGYHGDLNETFFVGNVSDVGKKLVQTTHECLQKAIESVHPGEKYREIGNVIQKYAQSKGFSVVRSYCGHGIHQLFHTAPSVPHYAKNKVVGIMKAGHCFTIEPMINQGNWRDDTWPDKWTAVTVDGLLSAQFEETLLVTDTGVEVLTRRLNRGGQPYFMDKS